MRVNTHGREESGNKEWVSWVVLSWQDTWPCGTPLREWCCCVCEQKNTVKEVTPTVGFNVEHFDRASIKFTVFDMSGAGKHAASVPTLERPAPLT